ncbi:MULTISPECIES: histidinol-phosphatase HisJ [Leuconostoc]|uniref:Histidinol-phosphatase n=2 Tax=Leuconostoc kimchii TaxID=136609 RepID=D5T519_LEUKI|nr:MULTISPECIES: histidinol-phosphatase HisJ [Leuconostoc]ADG41171.1 histidinol-phosphatase [Leuconostoc kimchii IMSNU 11154]AEJ30853.1 histidinol-phosphatase [Leuconostoc sp. C2]QBR47958.1 histidinol-phosphatase HisJ [Leuconostoc kimchii]
MVKKDGHTHTRFSHHGSDERLDNYIEQAISLGFTTYVVTEHAPLPTEFLAHFTGPVAAQNSSAMLSAELTSYQKEVARVQKKYAGQIDVKRGFEVDYLQNYESDIRQFLLAQADWIDEIVLSVHFLTNHDQLVAPIDFDPKTLATYFPKITQSPQVIFENYLATIQKSLDFAATLPDRFVVRIGHLTLIRKYQKYFNLPQFDSSNQLRIDNLLLQIKNNHFQLDLNTAGLRKPYNGETYPTTNIIKKAHDLDIEMVYGSDAHEASAVGQDYHVVESFLTKVKNKY